MGAGGSSSRVRDSFLKRKPSKQGLDYLGISHNIRKLSHSLAKMINHGRKTANFTGSNTTPLHNTP